MENKRHWGGELIQVRETLESVPRITSLFSGGQCAVQHVVSGVEFVQPVVSLKIISESSGFIFSSSDMSLICHNAGKGLQWVSYISNGGSSYYAEPWSVNPLSLKTMSRTIYICNRPSRELRMLLCITCEGDSKRKSLWIQTQTSLQETRWLEFWEDSEH